MTTGVQGSVSDRSMKQSSEALCLATSGNKRRVPEILLHDNIKHCFQNGDNGWGLYTESGVFRKCVSFLLWSKAELFLRITVCLWEMCVTIYCMILFT